MTIRMRMRQKLHLCLRGYKWKMLVVLWCPMLAIQSSHLRTGSIPKASFSRYIYRPLRGVIWLCILLLIPSILLDPRTSLWYLAFCADPDHPQRSVSLRECWPHIAEEAWVITVCWLHTFFCRKTISLTSCWATTCYPRLYLSFLWNGGTWC